VGADWYDTVYRPGLDAIRRSGLFELYASRNPTEADLFLWVYKLRRDLRAHDPTVGFDAAASHAHHADKDHTRREVRREGSRPLSRRITKNPRT
jgi:hypothetical protein